MKEEYCLLVSFVRIRNNLLDRSMAFAVTVVLDHFLFGCEILQDLRIPRTVIRNLRAKSSDHCKVSTGALSGVVCRLCADIKHRALFRDIVGCAGNIMLTFCCVCFPLDWYPRGNTVSICGIFPSFLRARCQIGGVRFKNGRNSAWEEFFDATSGSIITVTKVLAAYYSRCRLVIDDEIFSRNVLQPFSAQFCITRKLMERNTGTLPGPRFAKWNTTVHHGAMYDSRYAGQRALTYRQGHHDVRGAAGFFSPTIRWLVRERSKCRKSVTNKLSTPECPKTRKFKKKEHAAACSPAVIQRATAATGQRAGKRGVVTLGGVGPPRPHAASGGVRR